MPITVHPPACGFNQSERRFLMSIPGIGQGVVGRLESMGLQSLDALRRAGVEQTVTAICARQGNLAWKNRSRALARALHQSLASDRNDGCAG